MPISGKSSVKSVHFALNFTAGGHDVESLSSIFSRSEEEYLLNMAINAKQNVVTVASVKKPTGSTLTSGLDDVHQFPINSKV